MIITLDEGGSIEVDYANVLSIRSAGAVRIRRRPEKIKIYERAPDGSTVPAGSGNQCRHSTGEMCIRGEPGHF